MTWGTVADEWNVFFRTPPPFSPTVESPIDPAFVNALLDARRARVVMPEMERLHSSPLLFPSRLLDSARPAREGGALDLQRAGNLVSRLISWVNAYCDGHGRPDVITPDPIQERITLSRFRRTLCWHIYRKPRGLVAAAIQYGHIATTTTLETQSPDSPTIWPSSVFLPDSTT